MRIGVDGNEANVENKVGSSIYTFELLSYFKSVSSKDTSFIIYLRQLPNQHLPKEDKYFQYRVVKGPFYWSQIFLPLNLLLNRDINVFFSPAHYVPRFSPVPTVVTIHDLGYIYYPNEYLRKDLYKLNNWTQHAAASSCKVITVSQNTADDVIKFLKIDRSKIKVVYNGFRTSLGENNSSLPKNMSKPFILFVGTLQPRKNVARLLQAFSIFKKKNPKYHLVIAGKKGWMFEKIFEKVKELELEDSVIFTGFVDDNVLGTMYKNASLFVLPGLYEGFGLPVLEAMHLGCPVATSNTGALPEIAGPAAKYFDPSNTGEMAQVMNQIVNNAKIKQDLVKKGRSQVKKFSWEKCGQNTLDIIKRCAKQ